MNKALNWLYEHWMKGTPFYAFYLVTLSKREGYYK